MELIAHKQNAVKFKNFDSPTSRKSILRRCFDGIISKPKTKTSTRKRIASTPSKSDYFGPCDVQKNKRALPVPVSCLQAVLVMLTEQFNWSVKRANHYAALLGKSETVSMAKSKFKNKPQTWNKQADSAKAYLTEHFRGLTVAIPEL